MENMNISPAAGQPMPWYEVWMEVVTHPSRDSFRRILADPTARPLRAFIWVAVIGVIFGLLQLLITQVLGIEMYGDIGNLGLVTNMLCISIGTPIFSVIGLALGAGILRFIAAVLKGQGNFSDMVYCLGAVTAPTSIVSSLLSLIMTALSGGAQNLVSGSSQSMYVLCLLPFTLAIGIYVIVLEVLAVDTVEKFGTGKAVATVLAPVILAILLGICVAVFVAIFAVNTLGQ